MGLLLSGGGVLATSFFERPFPDVVRDAPVIMRGKVGNSHVEWTTEPDGTKRIFTYYEIHGAEPLKGAAPAGTTVMMRELGGEKDGVGMQVAGASHFDRGEDVVVFLNTPNHDGSYNVHGMMMGKYDVSRDTAGNEILSGAGVSSAGQGDSADKKPWTVDRLRQLIASQAEEPSAAEKSLKMRPKVSTSAPPPSPSPSPVAGAPQLQPTGSDDPPARRGRAFVLAGLGVLGAWLWLRRSRMFRS